LLYFLTGVLLLFMFNCI